MLYFVRQGSGRRHSTLQCGWGRLRGQPPQTPFFPRGLGRTLSTGVREVYLRARSAVLQESYTGHNYSRGQGSEIRDQEPRGLSRPSASPFQNSLFRSEIDSSLKTNTFQIRPDNPPGGSLISDCSAMFSAASNLREGWIDAI